MVKIYSEKLAAGNIPAATNTIREKLRGLS
jgi:hypothetical protein